jgi:pyridoxine/pyridoxamine 5'-phosphate oxidase
VDYDVVTLVPVHWCGYAVFVSKLQGWIDRMSECELRCLT